MYDLESKKEYLIKSYNNGASFAALGREIGCSECTIRNFLKKHITLRDNPKKAKNYESVYPAIIRSYNYGVSAYKMSIDLNIPLSSLVRILRKLNLDISHRSKIRDDKVKNHTDEII